MSDSQLHELAEQYLVGAVLSFLLSLGLGPALLIASALFGILWIGTHLIVLWRNRNPHD